MSGKSITFIPVIAVVGFSLVLAAEGNLGLVVPSFSPRFVARPQGKSPRIDPEAFSYEVWQEREDSNPRPLVLESNGSCPVTSL